MFRFFALKYAEADLRRVFEGMQPECVQSPPSLAFSTMAVFLPNATKSFEATSPAGPPPMMITSNLAIVPYSLSKIL